MSRAAHRFLSMLSLCVLTSVVVGCNLSTDDVAAPTPGQPCDEEGETSGSLVCEDGTWTEKDGELDAGFDVGDAAPTDDADTGCEPESDAEFCERLGIECGEFVGIDNCGDARSVDCGAEGFECGPLGNCLLADSIDALDINVCDCPDVDFDAPSDAICDEVGAECGEFVPADGCVQWDDIDPVSCGECPDGTDCGLAGANVCGCPCEIDEGCQDDGEEAPDNPCLICDPEASAAEFTPVDDGTPCGDNAICQGGECVCDEEAGYEECNNVCVNTDASADHCGGCNQPCSDNQVCDAGICQADCPSEQTECDGICVDTEMDDDHCGGCFQGCNENESCGGGLCKPDCASDEEMCSGQCVDTDSDPDHCGGCGQPCPGGDICDSGDCLECLDSADCDGAAQCHEQHPVCIDECCDFIAEDVVTDINISFAQLSIDVTDAGDPVIAFVDRDTDTIRIAERIGGNWYTQDVMTVSSTQSMRVHMVLDADDNPHLVSRRYEEWKYYWRDGSTWYDEEVWDEELSSGYTDLVVDSQGTVHIVGDHGFPESHRINYATYSPSTGWQREWFENVDDDRNFNWMAVDVTGDDEPVVALAVWDSGVRDLFVARRQGGGSWTAEMAVVDINQVMDMAVGPADEVILATVGTDLPHDGLELTSDAGGSWQTESINSRGDALHPQIAVDDLGDPHAVFSDTNPGQSHRHLSYTRWDGTAWQTEDVSQSDIERSQRQRIAVDGEYVAHIAVYDGNRDILSYVTVE